MDVSYSRVSSYRSCPQKHFFGYVERITPKKAIRPLTFGGDMHSLLEHRFNADALSKEIKRVSDAYNDLTDTQREDLGDTYLEDLMDVFSDYCEVYSEDKPPLRTEEKFSLKIGKYKGEPVNYVGIIDEIREGRVIGEHKTFSRKPDMDSLVMNTQVYLYARAMKSILGALPDKVVWDYIKSTPASEPVHLKSGKLSEAKSQSITPMSWNRACARHDLMNQAETAEKYAPNIENFFFRKEFDINHDMVEIIWKDFKNTVREIARKGGTNRAKHVTRDCSWCQYKPLCLAEFTGGDVEYTKEKEFKPREK